MDKLLSEGTLTRHPLTVLALMVAAPVYKPGLISIHRRYLNPTADISICSKGRLID